MRLIERFLDTATPAQAEYKLQIGSDEYLFRYTVPVSLEQYEQLADRIRNFVDVCQSPAAPPDWDPYLPLTRASAEKIALAHALVTELIYPDGSVEQLTERDWLEFAHRAGWQFLQLITHLMQAVGTSVDQGEQETMTQLGES